MRVVPLLLFAHVLLAYPPLPGEKLSDPVSEAGKTSYVDLLRLVFPDLEPVEDDPSTGLAMKSVPIRELGVTAITEAQQDASFTVQSVSAVHFFGSRVLLSFVADVASDIPERALALFELTPTPRLVDAAVIGLFPDDTGGCSAAFDLAPNSAAYICSANHHNSQQGYDLSRVLFVRDDRLEEIVRVDTLSCTGCAGGNFEQNAEIKAQPDLPRGMKKIVIRVEMKQPRRSPAVHVFNAAFRWDAQRRQFVADSSDLEKLEIFNKQNY